MPLPRMLSRCNTCSARGTPQVSDRRAPWKDQPKGVPLGRLHVAIWRAVARRVRRVRVVIRGSPGAPVEGAKDGALSGVRVAIEVRICPIQHTVSSMPGNAATQEERVHTNPRCSCAWALASAAKLRSLAGPCSSQAGYPRSHTDKCSGTAGLEICERTSITCATLDQSAEREETEERHCRPFDSGDFDFLAAPKVKSDGAPRNSFKEFASHHFSWADALAREASICAQNDSPVRRSSVRRRSGVQDGPCHG
jgi:hypothetical protein